MSRIVLYFSCFIVFVMCAGGKSKSGRCIIENRSNTVLDTVLISIGGHLTEFTGIAPDSVEERPFAKELLDNKSQSAVGGFGTVNGRNFTTPIVHPDPHKAYSEVRVRVDSGRKSTLTLK